MNRLAVGVTSVLLLVKLLFLVPSALAQDIETSRESITIMSDGTRLAGDLWIPSSVNEKSGNPAVLLVHGWGWLAPKTISTVPMLLVLPVKAT